MNRLLCRATLAIVAAWLFLGAAQAQESAPGAKPFRRVVVLGFDGADPALLEGYLAARDLPNLAALRQRGGYRRLATTTPAQSPVSWSSIITGLNPGKTGVYGFVRPKAGEQTFELTLTRWGEREVVSAFWQWFLMLATPVLVAVLLILSGRLVGMRGRIAVFIGLAAGGLLAALIGTLLFRLAPSTLPVAERTRQGTPFYEILARQDHPSVVLQGPMDFPPSALPNLRILCGLGVPDISGTTGSWSVFTTEVLAVERQAPGKRIVLLESRQGPYDVDLFGPRDRFVEEELAELDAEAADDYEAHEKIEARRRGLMERLHTRVPLRIDWKAGESSVSLTLPGQPPVTLTKGEWSALLPVTFRTNAIMTHSGLVRFHVARADSELLLYQEPIGWDPRRPAKRVPICWPADYAARLVDAVGLFETTGWACATNALRDGTLDDAAFVRDVLQGQRRRQEMLEYELKRSDWRCLFAVFTGIDRLQHLFWRHLDEAHPRYDAAAAVAGREAVRDMYRAMDRVVGLVTANVGDDTAVLVLSDHGFAPFRWRVNLNAWLRDNGYLVTRADGAGQRIDWSRTRAYAFGLGQIRVNVRTAASPWGIVVSGDRRSLAAEIAAKLEGLAHQGKDIVRRVDRRDDVYSGPLLALAPDLLPGFEAGYRAAAEAAFGDATGPVVSSNDDRWSGDHCSVSPDLVPGIFVSSVPPAMEQARGVDVAPSVLALLGIEPDGVAFDGRALFAPRR